MQSYSPASIGNPLAAPRPSNVKLYRPDVKARWPVEQTETLSPLYKSRQKVIGAVAFVAIALSGLTYKALDEAPPREVAHVQELAPPPAPYVKGLLDVIVMGEAAGNYNAYLRHPGNTSIEFTSMTLQQVLDWQDQAINNPRIGGSAVGGPQFIKPTLLRLVEQQNIDLNRPFDEALQDELATVLLEEAGLSDYISGRLEPDMFAYNISGIWAAVPMTIGQHPDESRYKGVGINKANITIEQIHSGIATVK